MRKQRADDVVTQGFLQLHVALRDVLFYGVSNEIIIHDFAELIASRCGFGKRDEELDIEKHALFGFFFKIMNTDVAHDYVVAQEKSAAIGQCRMQK
jgi:hypothetical protein